MGFVQQCREVVRLLAKNELRVVFAESCTAGLVSASLSRIPGVSEYHCGSSVTYRNRTKHSWLGVSAANLRGPGPVSKTVARQMALGVLQRTPEADLAVSVTGHLGPDAPPKLDGVIYVGLARRSRQQSGPTVSTRRFRLQETGRYARQREAVRLVLEQLLRALVR